MSTHWTTCPLCEASCGLRVRTDAARREILSIEPDPDDVLSRGHMCTKARALADLHTDPDRLRSPMRRTPSGEFVPIGWDDALTLVCERLDAVRKAHGRDAIGLYIGNPTVHNHEALVALVPLVAALRTRNRYSASSTDQWPQMFAAWQMFGHQLMIPVPDIDHTELMVIIGGNPVASNGSLMTAPGTARRLRAIRRRGGRVIVIDPRRTETAALADRHHFVRPGTDAALLLAVLHVLFAEGLVDLGRLVEHADGLDDIERLVGPWPPARAAAACGVPETDIVALAREIATAGSACVYGRVGACTQRFGGLTAWLIQLVNLLTANVDVRGGMMFPRAAFDGHAFARLLRQTGSHGAWHSRATGLAELGGELPVAAMADEIETPGAGQLRALITMAGNPVLSAPNGRRLEQALGTLDFMVSIDLYLNETSRLADLVLPPVSQLQRPTFHMALGMFSVRQTAKYRPAVLPTGPDERHDWQILMRLAHGLFARDGLAGRAAAAVVRGLERFGPRNFVDAALRVGPYGMRGPRARGLTVAELERQVHGVDLGPLQPALPARIYTRTRRIQLTPPPLVDDLARLERDLDACPGLALIGRRHVRTNNSWMHNTEHLAARPADCTLMMHPDDAASRDLTDGQRVTVRSRSGAVEVALEVTDDVMPGVVSLPHGWGHHRRGTRLRVARRTPGVSINDLTDERHLDDLTGNAGFCGVPVDVEAAPATPSMATP